MFFTLNTSNISTVFFSHISANTVSPGFQMELKLPSILLPSVEVKPFVRTATSFKTELLLPGPQSSKSSCFPKQGDLQAVENESH